MESRLYEPALSNPVHASVSKLSAAVAVWSYLHDEDKNAPRFPTIRSLSRLKARSLVDLAGTVIL